MDPTSELSQLLRPAGGGLYVVSTGRAEQEAMQRKLYCARNETEVTERWLASLAKIAQARVVVLGIPSDVGAGFLRGANIGPQAIRAHMLAEDPDYPAWCEASGVVDLGDVRVVPQLLHDEMLAPAQIDASRRALNSDTPDRAMPVSPLSIAERALDLVLARNPQVKPFMLGGDHSCAWPVTAALFRARPGFGIVQIDAHTDLLAERLGVRICFATWSHHANLLIGGQGRMTQVGIRATRHPRAHWESTSGVRQFWSSECVADEARAIDDIVAHVKSTGVRGVYFSNDIDGTDERWADATGTPEPGGLSVDFVSELIDRLGREVGLVAGDVVEVAPPIARTPGGAAVTLSTATRYMRRTLAALVA
jgi:agmatinase